VVASVDILDSRHFEGLTGCGGGSITLGLGIEVGLTEVNPPLAGAAEPPAVLFTPGSTPAVPPPST
jgi:hypothetical protein